jgi:hypothetical protein
MDARTVSSVVLALAGACLVLVGCGASSPLATPFAPTVQVVNSLPATTSGTTYAFQPLAGQADDAEYPASQERVRRHLSAHGWREVDRASAQLLVAFDYRVEAAGGRSDAPFGAGVRDVTGSVQAEDSYRNSGATSEARPATMTEVPSYGTGGFVRVASAEYARTARVVIADRATAEAGELKPLYEARARSVSPSSNLGAVLPGLLDAIFLDFPGPGGESRRVDVPPR